MNNEEILKQFEVIEQKVERVIEICKSHEETNLELTKKIRNLEEELQSKTEAEKHYQVVVVDTPCSTCSPDAEIIAAAAGSALVVAAARRTRVKALRAWTRRLSDNGVRLAGSLINAVE